MKFYVVAQYYTLLIIYQARKEHLESTYVFKKSRTIILDLVTSVHGKIYLCINVSNRNLLVKFTVR